MAAPQGAWVHPPEANLAGVVQAVLLDVGLEVGGAAHGPALGAAVRRLVSVDPLVGTVTALVGQHHLAHLARLMEERLRLLVVLCLGFVFFSPQIHPRKLPGLKEEQAYCSSRASTAQSSLTSLLSSFPNIFHS